MSHELRTPLNAVLTFTESLTEGIYGPVNPRQGSALRMVMESGQRLLTLINDLLDLARIEAGRADLDQVFTDVHLACRSSLEMVRELAGRKQLSMQLDWDPQAAALRVDPRALKQMLGNLLGNAVKFTPQGGRIGLRVRGDYERGEMLFTVWDTGIGISEEQAARLFQPFVQLDNGLARAYEGAGMGLALVYRLCELHGGSVTLESAPGQGSRFTIALPWNALEQPGEAQPAAFAGRQAAPAGSPAAQPSQGVSDAQPGAPRPVKILIAEDNPANQVVYEDFLSSLGYQVFAAVNGQDALELAARLTPDLILMDIQMPVMNGLDALECLHGSPALAHIPVIALTALAMPGDRERCLNAGAREYLAKPVSLKLLAEMVHRYAR
ncbi:MAG: hybrid sensor histidine kinase/response regulator, partial [Chloroflexota bacterium]